MKSLCDLLCRKSLSLVKELIETCLTETDGSVQLHAAKVILLLLSGDDRSLGHHELLF